MNEDKFLLIQEQRCGDGDRCADSCSTVDDLQCEIDAMKEEAQKMIDTINELDERSQREEYLDTGEALGLLDDCRQVFKNMVD